MRRITVNQNKSVTRHIYSVKVKPGLNGQLHVNNVSFEQWLRLQRLLSLLYIFSFSYVSFPSLRSAGYSFHNAGECLSLNEMEMVEDY